MFNFYEEQGIENYTNIDGEWIYFENNNDYDEFIRIKKIKLLKQKINGLQKTHTK